jgi:hypothetical protein
MPEAAVVAGGTMVVGAGKNLAAILLLRYGITTLRKSQQREIRAPPLKGKLLNKLMKGLGKKDLVREDPILLAEKVDM